MPQLGETVAEGTVLRWLKQVGDAVDDQEPLLEIATDKVDTEVPSPAAGVLLEIVVGEDATVAVGTVLAHLGSAAPAEGAASPAAGPAATGEPPRTPAPTGDSSAATDADGAAEAAEAAGGEGGVHGPGTAAPPAGVATTPSGPRHRHSPRVRRLAREAGLDPDTIDGTGSSGRVTPDDVARAARAGEDARAGEPEPMTAPSAAAAGPAGGAPSTSAAGTRHAVDGPRGARSLRTVTATVDLTSLLRAAAGGGAAADDAFVAVATTRAVAALRACPGLLGAAADSDHVAVLVRRTAADGVRETLVDQAEELNADGIRRRLREASTTSSPSASTHGTAHATVEFTGDEHVVVDVEDPGPGQVVSIGVSRPSPHVVVVDQEGAAGIGIRQTAYLSVCFDQDQVDAPLVRTFVRDLVARLTSP
ncbi:MAG TPA: biotin/lipoyl-containing protein [Pedococcus sp.]|nr:biotin/lipoyl-containing protein [Pedococcus sp.]